jgi:uncharacterized protein YjiS (DUF1127 family)
MMEKEKPMIILALIKSAIAAPVSATARIARVGFGQVAGFFRSLKHRRDVIALGALDDRSLKDIGLVRSDIAGALATSYFDDPSLVLADRNLDRDLILDDVNGASLRRGAADKDKSDAALLVTHGCATC